MSEAIMRHTWLSNARCPSCGQYESITVEVTCLDEEGEQMRFTVCRNCDYGINEHTEGVCSCVG